MLHGHPLTPSHFFPFPDALHEGPLSADIKHRRISIDGLPQQPERKSESDALVGLQSRADPASQLEQQKRETTGGLDLHNLQNYGMLKHESTGLIAQGISEPQRRVQQEDTSSMFSTLCLSLVVLTG